jgi:putative flippase GtrA
MRTGFWFLVVGGSAAAVHMAVFMLAAPYLWPEVANAVGFCIAFVVSFAGHRFLSFSDAETTLWQSLRRFAATALAGFAANEVMFVALLRGLDFPDWLALFFALVFASAQTFLLSRFWAFRRAQ